MQRPCNRAIAYEMGKCDKVQQQKKIKTKYIKEKGNIFVDTLLNEKFGTSHLKLNRTTIFLSAVGTLQQKQNVITSCGPQTL